MTRNEGVTSRMNGAYGQRLGECFGLDREPEHIRIDKTAIALTRISCNWADNGLTAPLPVEDAFLISVQLRDCADHDLWIDGRPRRTGALSRGDVSIYDLRTGPVVNSKSPFRNLHFYAPRAALNAIAMLDELEPVDELPNEPGLGRADPVIAGLAYSLEPAFDQQGHLNTLFVDHLTTAIAAHVIRTFGHRTSISSPDVILSAAQERVAKEILSANLTGDVTTADLAEACGLTLEGFRNGFRRATGMFPHQWLMRRRMDLARSYFADTDLSRPEVALRCGFADVRHMERVFRSTQSVVP